MMQNEDPHKPTLSPSDANWPPMIQPTEIPGLLVYERETFPDERGFFREVVELRDVEKVLGKKIAITQWNHSRSVPNVIRGFHAEPWEKIIYVSKGNALSVLVDLRIDSPAFGKTIKFTLNDQERKTLYIPNGVGNSFCNVGDTDMEYMYMVTDYYAGKPTPAVAWNDPMLMKQFGGWPIKEPIIGEKDQHHPTLKEKFADQVDFSKFSWLKEE